MHLAPASSSEVTQRLTQAEEVSIIKNHNEYYLLKIKQGYEVGFKKAISVKSGIRDQFLGEQNNHPKKSIDCHQRTIKQFLIQASPFQSAYL